MKKVRYILIVLFLFLSFTAVNVLAGEVDKAKQGQIKFTNAIAQDSELYLNIDAQNVSDDEMKMVIGKFHYGPVKKGSGGGDNNEDPSPPPKEDNGWKDQLWQYYTLLQFNNPYDRANW